MNGVDGSKVMYSALEGEVGLTLTLESSSTSSASLRLETGSDSGSGDIFLRFLGESN